MAEEPFTLCRLERATWVVTRPTGLGLYDFAFEPLFTVDHPAYLPHPVTAIARLGAADDYPKRYDFFSQLGIRLVHTPEQYALGSWLPNWYPKLEGVTPRSLWFDRPPSAREVGDELGWPVFVKGGRQTSKHQRRLCVAESPEDFDRIMGEWEADPILWWQGVVCRAWVRLRKVADPSPLLLPMSHEFRSFWYRGNLVGIGRYWTTVPYGMTDDERRDALRLAAEAVERLGLDFIVIDLAQTETGSWTVIECNDGQDAGYAGVDRAALWREVVEIDCALVDK